MAHVDYRRWAGYAHDRLQEHAPAAKCRWGRAPCWNWAAAPGRSRGNSSRAARTVATSPPTAPRRCSRSPAAGRAQSLLVCFRRARFTRAAADFAEDALPPGHEPPFDAVLLLYDGLNYLLEERRGHRLLAEAARLLRPGGLFPFDQSTPANSAADRAVFEHEGAFERAAYDSFTTDPSTDQTRRVHWGTQLRG